MVGIKDRLLSTLPKKSFARSASLLVGGTLGSQALLILVSPLLTRLYSPSDFGLLAVYTSILTITLLISSLRYDVAIPLPEDDVEAVNVFALSLALVGMFAVTTSIIVLFWRDGISELLEIPSLADFLWLLPVGILIAGTFNVLVQWNVRKKKFGLIASTKLRQALVAVSIQLLAFKLNGLALILAQISSNGTGVTRLSKPNFNDVSWEGLKQAAIRYQRFPLFSAPAGLARVTGVELPALILTSAFNPAAAGLYALTNRVLGVPANVLGGAVSQVFTSGAAEAYRAGKLGILVRDLYAKMAQIGLPFMLLLMMLGPSLFSLVFGKEWAQAGEFARWMAPWLYLVFVSSPITTVTAVMERQKQGLLFHLSLLAARMVALYLGVLSEDLMITVMLLASVNAVWRLGFLFWIYIISGNTVRSFVVDSSLALFKALICVSPVAIALLFFNGFLVHLFVVSMLLILLMYWNLLKQAY